MKRWIFFAYGVVCHLLFLAICLYLAGFVGGFVVPKTIDTPASGSVGVAIAIDFCWSLCSACSIRSWLDPVSNESGPHSAGGHRT